MWRPTQPADPAARAARIVTVVATVVFALIVLRCRPWDLFVREAYSNDFYDEQARSFLRLRTAVRPEIAGMEGFVVEGRTYLYYGPFLSFVRLPFAVFGDLFFGRLARLSMILGHLALLTGAFHLVRRWTSSPWRVAGFVAAVAWSPVLFLTGWVSVYHETELWAAAFATWAVVGVLRLVDRIGTDVSPTRRELIAAAFPIAAGITTRASVGIGIAAGACLAVAIPLVRARFAEHRETLRRWTPTNAAVIGASALGFAIHGGLNWIKFGSPTKLPGQLQVLSLTDPSRAEWFAGNNDSFFSLRFLPTTVVHYLRPDTVRFERLFPFVRYGPLATDRGSYPMETITPSASLTTSAALLLGVALVGIVLVLRHRRWTLLALTFGGAIAAGPTFTIGFIGNRYLVDMLPMLMIPAAYAFGTLVLPSHAVRRALRIATVGLVAWGVWCNTALALWTQQLKEPGFTSWRYRVDGWVFGDPAPALTDAVPGAPVPRDGVVGLARDEFGECAGVYIAEQGVWVALERTNGVYELVGDLTAPTDPDVGIRLAGGDDWIVGVSPADGGVQFQYAPGGDPAVPNDGTVVGDVIAVPDDGVLRDVRIVADPVVGQLSVTVGDELALFRFGAPPSPMIPFTGFDTDPAPGDSLCRQLEARR